jgi:hypothetical protein
MALQAYPDVPLFRYPYTDLTERQIPPSSPWRDRRAGSKGGLETDLAGTSCASSPTAPARCPGSSARATG